MCGVCDTRVDSIVQEAGLAAMLVTFHIAGDGEAVLHQTLCGWVTLRITSEFQKERKNKQKKKEETSSKSPEKEIRC